MDQIMFFIRTNFIISVIIITIIIQVNEVP